MSCRRTMDVCRLRSSLRSAALTAKKSFSLRLRAPANRYQPNYLHCFKLSTIVESGLFWVSMTSLLSQCTKFGGRNKMAHAHTTNYWGVLGSQRANSDDESA